MYRLADQVYAMLIKRDLKTEKNFLTDLSNFLESV